MPTLSSFVMLHFLVDFEAEEQAAVDNAERRGLVWVVGVEDFMRRFLPGKSSARSIFALAQLNGIVKYACQKVFTRVGNGRTQV